MTRAGDGFDDTRMVVRGRSVATASATFSIRNDGHLPFTVHGLDAADTTDWLAQQQVTFARGLNDDARAPRAGQVTLDPGDSALVYWSLDLACKGAVGPGGFVTIDALRFRVTWLGIPATRELPLDLPITFAEDDESRPPPSPDCAKD